MNPDAHDDREHEFKLGYQFTAGWCDLTVRSGQLHVRLRATNLADFFGDLVRAVVQLADGRRAATCMWGDEPGGSFVDLARGAPDSLCGLVVHSFADYDWINNERRQWIPARGRNTFATLQPFDIAMREFIFLFRRVEVLNTDRTGFIPEWGWRFPQEDLAHLESVGLNFGYRPTSTARIEREFS